MTPSSTIARSAFGLPASSGIEFVVASGNQYYQLISLEIRDRSRSSPKTARWF
jgi:hypothetical protein